MKILTKKILRDIRYQKGRSLSIIIIIALAMGLYTGILLAYENADNAFTEAENEANLHSVRYISADPVNTNDLNIDQFDSVTAWDTRLSLISSFHIGENTAESFTAPMYGIKPDQRPRVDDLQIISGNYLEEDNDILLEQGFLDSKELDIGDSITLNFEGQSISLNIAGGVFSAEYLYNVNPKTGLPDLTSVAPIWGSLDFFQEISGFNGINELIVRFNDNIHLNQETVNDHISEILTYLQDDIDPTFASIELSDEPDQQMKEGDLGALDDFARVFGGVVLLIALFAIYDNISKMIAGQRNYIGTMRALGGSKNKVTRHYTSLAMTLSSIGIGIGVPLGLGISYGMVYEYTSIIGIPTPDMKFFADPILEGLGVHLLLTLIISFFTSARAANIEPREAMSSSYITQVFKSKPIVERFLVKIGKMEPTTAIPIRNIFRNKRKTTITIFTFAMSIVLMVAALAFVDSFNSAIEENYDERQQFDLEIYLAHSMISQEALNALDQIEEISQKEGFVNQIVTISDEQSNNDKTTAIYGYQSDSHLRNFEFTEGNAENAVIGTLLSQELELDVGDTLNVFNTTLEISGIANEMISEAIFMSIDNAQNLLNLQNNVTGLIIELEDGTDIDKMREEINSVLPVSLIISTQEVKDSIEYLIQGIFAIVGVMVLIGFLTVALFSFNTIVLEIISRENEFVNLKSLGSNNKKILKIIILQSFVVTIGGALIAIPMSYMITTQTINAMMDGLMNIETVISFETFAISIGSAFLASLTGIIAAYRHVKNIDLVESMRNRVSN